MTPADGPRPDRDARDNLERLLARRRPNAFTAAWRWRYELATVTAPAYGIVQLARAVGVPYTALTAGVATVLVAGWAPARRWVIGRFWCVVTPHRVRAAIMASWLDTRSGHLPTILWTKRTPYGERLVLMPRAGQPVERLAAALPSIVTACWAREATLEVHPRRPGLLVLRVIRREKY